ncbi:MAG: hypothetical protein QNJ41_00040 [Xenococcaceae cyanobacterium MO_188.B32]|nr:hypothetical protein [Xenococcaceae cyanobacterium MO_188.B32]
MKHLQSLVKISVAFGIATTSTFCFTQPAKALLINTFEFTDEDGINGGAFGTGSKVTGEIRFDSINPGDSANNLAADSVIINNDPGLEDALGTRAFGYFDSNLVSKPAFQIFNNSFNIENGVISSSLFSYNNGFDFFVIDSSDLSQAGTAFGGIQSDIPVFIQDNDSSSLTFSASAAVPFEFSPSFGFFLVGSVFTIFRCKKSYKDINSL